MCVCIHVHEGCNMYVGLASWCVVCDQDPRKETIELVNVLHTDCMQRFCRSREWSRSASSPVPMYDRRQEGRGRSCRVDVYIMLSLCTGLPLLPSVRKMKSSDLAVSLSMHVRFVFSMLSQVSIITS